MRGVHVHIGDTDQKWWKNANGYEGKGDVKVPILSPRSLLATYHPADNDYTHTCIHETKQNKNEIKARVAEFLSFVKYSKHDTIVCVGHSAFFKKLCSSSVGEELAQNRPVMHDSMRERKLNNSAVLAVTVDFGADAARSDGGQPLISDADLMFGYVVSLPLLPYTTSLPRHSIAPISCRLPLIATPFIN